MWTLVYLWSQEGKCPDTRKPRPVCPHQTGQATRRPETPMVVTVSSTDPRSVKALALLPRARTWTHGTRKCDGRAFLIAPASTPGHSYYVDARGAECTCPDRQTRRVTCKHMLAARLLLV